MAGKVTVGTVYLKVQPDLDGFRRKVEQGTKGLKDVDLDVNPDMDGFRQKVKSATKGMKADVEVVANTKRMIAETKAAMKKISDDAQRKGHLRLQADFAHASADRKIKRFLDKANATSIVHLKVAGLNKGRVSTIPDQIEKAVSRKPVKIRFLVQRAQLNKAMSDVRASLKKFSDGTKRYRQLSLGTSPKDSGSQRKMQAYLDQVKTKVGKLRNAYDATATSISKSNEKIRESTRKTKESVKGFGKKLVPEKIQRQIRLANAIDPGKKVRGSKTGQFADRLIVLRNRLNEYSKSARAASTETRRIAAENKRAASSFSKLNKKTTGFGGRRRRGLKSIDEVGTERFAGLSRIGWMVSAIAAIAAPAVQLVSGLAAALPALGGVALAALGVTLLGLDGIKEAAKAAAPALDRAKEAVSGVFQQRLTPQFAQLGNLLDNISPQLQTMAHGMSDFTQGLTDGLTSDAGTGNIQKLLTNSADLFSKMKPFAKDFTEGLLEMAGAGSETFPSLAEGMNRFGSSFKKNISELSASGELQSAIQATYDVVGSLGTNLGRILRSGIETAPSMAESLTPLFDGFADGVVSLMPVLSSFSEMVGPALGTAFSEIGDIADRMAPGLTTFFDTIGPGLQDLVSGVGDLGGAVLGPLADFLGGIAPGAGDIFSAIGQGMSEFAQAANNMEGLPGIISGVASAVSNFLSDTARLNGFGQDLGLNALEIEEGLGQYGSAFTRGVQGFTGESGLIRAAADDVSRVIINFLSSMEDNQNKLRAAAERAEGALEIDLSPQIKQIDTAKTNAELRAIQDEIEMAIREGTAQSTKIEPTITVDPKIDMAGSLDQLSAASGRGSFADLRDQINQFKANAEAIASEASIDISPQIKVLESATNINDFSVAAQTITDTLRDQIEGTPTAIDPNLTLSQTAPVDTAGVTDGVKQQVETDINAALSAVDLDMSGTASAIGSQLGDALGGVDVPLDGLTSSVTSQIDGLVSEVSAKLTEVTTAFQTEGDAGSAAFSGAMETMSATSVGTVSGMAASIQSALSMDLTANGAAVGNTFAAGLESTVGRVRNAAAAMAAAVAINMPHSPAKEGPLSGKGWVDTSGVAVGVEFAQGIRSTVGEVADATQLVAGAVNDQLSDFQIAPQANMEAFKKDAVLQPVLEANAKKIADFRKREEERAEKHNERLAKIDENKSKGDKKEEQRVKAREDLAKQSSEAYEKLLESLEEPDYASIDRSIQGYWIDGYKDVFKDALKSSMSAADFTGSLQRAVKGATSQIRDTLGDHPILAQVEANVDADAFHWAVYNAIEESGIHEVPINLALANVDQFKRDLGMGDGVLSRALDQAVQFDPARNDKRRYEEEKTEVHYHVTDMEEAIRLEQKRERLELMRLPR